MPKPNFRCPTPGAGNRARRCGGLMRMSFFNSTSFAYAPEWGPVLERLVIDNEPIYSERDHMRVGVCTGALAPVTASPSPAPRPTASAGAATASTLNAGRTPANLSVA
ncbi:hypothetical protein DL764_004586 [Monosporascus ibericus]|uniref:Uncharacterized protein n=1 Tax=Monosporascus ibericus TaxID=155417 RepID=A0A4Q4TFP7_9PEZI|nr:hypothetical protein DL764_004586 [Monosporascus ibericus]